MLLGANGHAEARQIRQVQIVVVVGTETKLGKDQRARYGGVKCGGMRLQVKAVRGYITRSRAWEGDRRAMI